VENLSLLRKSNLALQLARKFEGEKKRLLEKTENLTKELLEARKMVPATGKLHEECHSSPNTSTDVSEIVSHYLVLRHVSGYQSYIPCLTSVYAIKVNFPSFEWLSTG
jgi:hypothetical protein